MARSTFGLEEAEEALTTVLPTLVPHDGSFDCSTTNIGTPMMGALTAVLPTLVPHDGSFDDIVIR